MVFNQPERTQFSVYILIKTITVILVYICQNKINLWWSSIKTKKV